MFSEHQQIGYYTLIRLLGKGGFGEVWLAEKRNVHPTERVAIKLPRDEQIDLQAVKNEIFNWILSGKHKNILPIIECETFGNQVAIVSEYAPDGSLRDLLQKRGKLPAAEAVQMMTGILEGLAHLHGRKIIHRDLKPENILLFGNTPQLTDFGISRAVAEGNSTSAILGTQAFMSPEAFDGKRTPQTDIWSVGVIFYLLLTGSLPFPQKDFTALIGAIVMQDPPSLPDDITDQLQSIVKRALAKDPASRYQTAAEMLEDINQKFLFWENSSKTFSFDLPVLPKTPPLTPVQSAATEILTAPTAKKPKTAVWLLSVLSIIAFCAAITFTGYLAVQSFRSVGEELSTNANNSGGINTNPPTQRVITEFSVDLIDEALAGIEKEHSGKAQLTRFLLNQNEGNFIVAVITVKDVDNPEFYDVYTYYYGNGTLSKKPLKDPSSFEKAGGKWFYKEDINWNALTALRETISAKAREIGERDDDQVITVGRKLMDFSPERYGDVVFEIKNSGARRDINLSAGKKGDHVELKID